MDIPQAPAAPDPVATAAAQSASNKDTAVTQYGLSATNQVTPSGSLNYSQIGTWSDGTPRFQATTSLSPDQQSLYDKSNVTQNNLADIGNQQSARIGQQLNTPFQYNLPGSVNNVQGGPIQSGIANAGSIKTNVANAGPIQSSIGAADTSADRTKVEDALYSRLNPQLDRDTAALQTQLINKGVRPGSEAWTQAIDADNRSRTDARMQVIGAGGAEQSRLFGIDQAQGQFADAAQNQQYTQNANDAGFTNQAQGQQYTQNANDATFGNSAQAQQFAQLLSNANLSNTQRAAFGQQQLTERNQPINEISALLSGSQVSNPSFVNAPTPGVAPTDVIGAQQQSLNQQNVGYQAQVAQNQAITSGLFGLGSAALGGWGYGGFKTSDARAKENISRVGKTDDGLPIYKYSYKGNGGLMEMGVMAQDVLEHKPEAVAIQPSGLFAVDYGQIGEAA